MKNFFKKAIESRGKKGTQSKDETDNRQIFFNFADYDGLCYKTEVVEPSENGDAIPDDLSEFEIETRDSDTEMKDSDIVEKDANESLKKFGRP